MAKNAFLTQLKKHADKRQVVKNEEGNVNLISGRAVLEIPLDKISEDPAQPRTDENQGFSEEAIQGLADSIEANGLLQPISVHADPKRSGYYVINHGARRFRAMKLAGRETISAVVDEAYSQQKQLIENLQRENLSLAETVESLARIRPAFKTQRELAKAVGKSDAWVAQMLVLAKLDPAINELMRSGRCQDTLVLNGLQKLAREDAQAADDFIAGGSFSRADFEAFKKELAEKEAEADEQEVSTVEASDEKTSTVEKEDEQAGGEPEAQTGGFEDEAGESGADDLPEDESADDGGKPDEKHQLSTLVITIDGRRARLVLDRPLAVRFEASGEIAEVRLNSRDL